MFRTATPNIPQSWSTTSVAGDGLRDRGVTEVACLISTDDEAFTYNNRVNSIAIIQEHKMILKAIENGVSEERIAKSLNVDVASIRRRWNTIEKPAHA